MGGTILERIRPKLSYSENENGCLENSLGLSYVINPQSLQVKRDRFLNESHDAYNVINDLEERTSHKCSKIGLRANDRAIFVTNCLRAVVVDHNDSILKKRDP